MADYTRAWDETVPPDTQAANQLGVDLRQLKQDVRERLALIGNVADRPTPTATETGFAFFAKDEGKWYRWNGAAWDDVTTSFAPVPLYLSGLFADRPATAIAGQLYLAIDTNQWFRWYETAIPPAWVDVTIHIAVSAQMRMASGTDIVSPGAGMEATYHETLGWRPRAAIVAFGFNNPDTSGLSWNCYVSSLDDDGFTYVVDAASTDDGDTRINWIAME